MTLVSPSVLDPEARWELSLPPSVVAAELEGVVKFRGERFPLSEQPRSQQFEMVR